jgi:TonB-like protein
VSPVYPSTLQNASGIVLLEARVGIDGFLSDIRDVTGSRSTPTHEAFLASAIDAVRQWEFRPTLLNDVPVEANIRIKIDYSTR